MSYHLTLYFLLSIIWNISPTYSNGEIIYKQKCSQCHGVNAEGNSELKAPPLAGIPKYYSKTQLTNFKAGIRGAIPKDIAGYSMHLISKELTELEISSVVDYLESLPRYQSKSTLKGNISEGNYLFNAHCMICHRYNASGEITFGSPPLNHLPAWYIKEQLQKFKNGLRGHHPKDLKGTKMKYAVLYLNDDNAMNDVISYIKTLK